MIELNGRIASHGFHWRHYFGAKLEVGGGKVSRIIERYVS